MNEIEIRYPDFQEEPTLEQAQEALVAALSVRDDVLSALGIASDSSPTGRPDDEGELS